MRHLVFILLFSTSVIFAQDTLRLTVAKAFPTAEGAGSIATGARLQGSSRKLGRVTSIAGPTTGSLVGTYNGVQLYEGNMKYLMGLENIFIVPRTSGRPNQKDEDEGNETTKSWHLFGDNITYLGMLGQKDNISHDIKLRFGSEGSLSSARNTGQDNLIIRGLKVYLSDPPIGTATTSSYGRNAVSIFNSNTLIFDSCNFAYGGDQTIDISGQYDASTGVTPKYVGDFTMQNSIIGNGYGTGSLQGSNNNTALDSKNYTNAKNLWINHSHRQPNTRATTLATPQQYHTYNNYIYNWYGNRSSNLVPNEYCYWVNNLYNPGPDTGSNPNGRMFKYDVRAISANNSNCNGELYISGNIVEGSFNYSTNNKTLVQYFQTELGNTANTTVQDCEFTATNTPPPHFYDMIPTTDNGILVKDHVTTYAGSRWATGTDGNRVSDIDALMQLWIDDAKNDTNNSMPDGLKNDITTNEIIPTLTPGGNYTDSNNNLIADTFEATHSLSADPFAVKEWWTFTDGGTYVVGNLDPDTSKRYTNLEMYSFWINNDFRQLLLRGDSETDDSYSVNGNEAQQPTEVAIIADVVEISILQGEALQLGWEVSPSGVSQSVTWTSGDTGIVTVNSLGQITGVSVGVTIVTATSTVNTDLSDTIGVRVTSNAPPSTTIGGGIPKKIIINQ